MSEKRAAVAAPKHLARWQLRAVSDAQGHGQTQRCCKAENGGYEPTLPNYSNAASVSNQVAGRPGLGALKSHLGSTGGTQIQFRDSA